MPHELVNKAVKVVESCETWGQWLSASQYAELVIKRIAKTEPKLTMWAEVVLLGIVSSHKKFLPSRRNHYGT